MLEPNSIRSLLRHRQSAKLRPQSGSQEDKPGLADPDIDEMFQTKSMIKDIDHQVDDIRKWRQHQKLLTQEKLKCNAEVMKAIESEHEKYLERQEEREKEENNKLLEKLKSKKITIEEKQEQLDSDKIFQVLNQTDNIRENIKNSQLDYQTNDQYEALLESVSCLNKILKKDQTPTPSTKQEVKPSDLKQELDEIEREFAEMEDLLK